MFTLIKNASVFAPEPLGNKDILIANGAIAAIDSELTVSGLPDLQEIDARGKTLIPGLIDGHVHLIGGGGEGGFATRTPEVVLSDLIKAGVTTVVGLLGTDCSSRHISTLLAKAKGLTAEGISAYMFTGGYAFPSPTFSHSIRDDIAFLDPVIGLKIAIADHRSSQLSTHELSRITSEARIGGLLSGKAGRVVIHLGAGEYGFTMLEDVVEKSDLPRSQFIPTHANRKNFMFDQSRDWVKQGGFTDYTAGINPHKGARGGVKVSEAIAQCLHAGLNLNQVCVSSDGNGSIPKFDGKGNLMGLTMSGFDSLLEEIRDMHFQEKIPLENAIIPLTRAPSNMLGFNKTKGTISLGKDADFLLLDSSLTLTDVFAKGRAMLKNGELIVKGTFER